MDFAGLAVGGVSSIMNFGLQNAQNKLYQEREYGYNEAAARNAYQRNIDYYNNFLSPQAKIKQLKEAGLSPSLASSQGITGAQGMSQPQGKGVTGGTPNVMDPLSSALIAAQIDNIEADTQVKEKEIPKMEAETGLANAQAKTEEAKKTLTEYEAEYQDLENYIKSSTLNTDIEIKNQTANRLKNESTKLFWEAENEKITYEFNEDSYDKRLQLIDEQMEEIISQKNLNRAEARKIRRETDMIIKEYNLEVNKEIWKRWNLKEDRKLEYKKMDFEKKLAEYNKKAEYKIQQMLAKYHLTEVELQSVTNVITSLIHSAGLYGAGGFSQRLRNANSQADRDAEYTKQRNLVLYGNEYGEDPELLR